MGINQYISIGDMSTSCATSCFTSVSILIQYRFIKICPKSSRAALSCTQRMQQSGNSCVVRLLIWCCLQVLFIPVKLLAYFVQVIQFKQLKWMSQWKLLMLAVEKNSLKRQKEILRGDKGQFQLYWPPIPQVQRGFLNWREIKICLMKNVELNLFYIL